MHCDGVVVGRQNNFLPIGSSVVVLPPTATDSDYMYITMDLRKSSMYISFEDLLSSSSVCNL